MICALTSCASVTATKTADGFTWHSKTLFKDVQDIEAAFDDFIFTMEGSSGEMTPDMACALGYKPACGS